MRNKIMMLAAMTVSMIFFASGISAEPPCKADREKFCKDVQQGGGRLIKCFKANEAKLSKGCKAQIVAMKKNVKEANEACHDDVMSFCQDVKKGGGRVVKCLHENEDKISADCKAKLPKPKKK